MINTETIEVEFEKMLNLFEKTEGFGAEYLDAYLNASDEVQTVCQVLGKQPNVEAKTPDFQNLCACPITFEFLEDLSSDRLTFRSADALLTAEYAKADGDVAREREVDGLIKILSKEYQIHACTN